ncbi:MAG: nucleotidyltransferase family protein [Candidatus Bathyarchaeota archaeon]|nr:nucleotidyltransferase family protein [Candidatus Bathyarchaeota archaeon]
MIVAFIGNDGSGKTTLAKRFKEFLEKKGLTVVYQKEFEYLFLKYLSKISKAQRLRKVMRENYERKRVPVYLKLWTILVWFDSLIRLFHIKILKRTEINLMDRFVYDFLMSWEYLGCSNEVIRLMYLCFPKPDIVILTDVSPEIAYNRKKATHNYSLRFYKVQRERYLQLAKMLNIRIVNTRREIEKCLEEIFLEFRRKIVSSLSEEDRIILLLSYPDLDYQGSQKLVGKIAWKKLRWDYIIDMVTRNNVEMIFLENLLDSYSEELPENIRNRLISILRICKIRKEKMLNVLQKISEKFSEEEIEFVVFKTFQPYTSVPSDIDILVRRKDFERCAVLLRSFCDERRTHIFHKAVTFVINGVDVDLHYEISWSGVKLFNEDEIWKSLRTVAIKNTPIQVPSCKYDMLIVSSHSIFQHHYTTLGDFLSISLSLRELSSHEIAEMLKENYLSVLIVYCSLKASIIYNSKFLSSSGQLRLNPEGLAKIVFFHPHKLIPKKNAFQLIDCLLGVYRKIKFKATHELPYNVNWLRSHVVSENVK